MEENNQQNNQKMQDKQRSTTTQKPNEMGGFDISGFVKIHDPNTNETFVEARA